MKSAYLVCYDIADELRLNRIFRFMKGRGFHLQYSVFYCYLSETELKELKAEIQKMIHPKYDDVRIYQITKDSLVAILGVGDRIPEGVEVFYQD